MEIPYKNYPEIPPKILNEIAVFSIDGTGFHEIILHQHLNTVEQKKFNDCIEKYHKGTPIEYILGKCNFYGLDFAVNDSVLIPRIDTEILVENAIKFIGEQKINVLELCTGSGCIAVSLAKHCKNIEILAVDISTDALEVCKTNIAKHKLESRIIPENCDALKQIPNGSFDLLIANPPYIESNTITNLEYSVKNFEPHLALDGGSDGLIFYRAIFNYLKNKQIPAFLEIGFNQEDAITILGEEFGIKTQIIKDYAQNPRVCICIV